MNEESHLLSSPPLERQEPSDRRSSSFSTCSSRSVWKTALASFMVGVVMTLLVTSHVGERRVSTSTATTTSVAGVPMLGKKKHKSLSSSSSSSPPLHYFAKASTDFAASLPPLPPNVDDSFLDDLVTSTDKHAPITSGFYRQEAGEPLVYTYTYHEMKIIVAGEFHISDDQGNSVVATAGDVFYFPKGSTITFSSPSFGLGFFCGQRPTGKA